MIQGIIDRVGDLNDNQTDYLNRMLQYFRDDSLGQKIRNAAYLIGNYRTIFTKA